MTNSMTPGMIAARLDRLPATRSVWTMLGLLSLGGLFEFFDLFMAGYIAPGMLREKIIVASTGGWLGVIGISGFATFVAAFFAGLWVGTLGFSFIADRYGRRAIFTFSLLWYAIASVIMVFQYDTFWVVFWRFVAGVGVGVELVTVDTYISELAPASLRGRAFAFNQVIQFSAVPMVALLAYLLVPYDDLLGFSGWRWVVLLGSTAAVFIWWIRLGIPESPRWLSTHGRMDEADRIVAGLEARVAAETGAPLPLPQPPREVPERGSFSEIFAPPYRNRTFLLVIFNIFQTIGYYGFGVWVVQLVASQGVDSIRSSLYSFVIALAAPVGPLLGILVADRIERKWQVVLAAFAVACFGLLFAQFRDPLYLILCGIGLTLANNIMSFSFHAYQTELYPTRIRALAVGFVYSFSRISVVFSSFIIAFILHLEGAQGVFVFIAAAMAVVMLDIGLLGPRTKDLGLESISH